MDDVMMSGAYWPVGCSTGVARYGCPNFNEDRKYERT